tara:strand:+ start:421 stop:1041 length:621 start_codon:yes stop_codon:yes gene_type:complete
MSSRQYYIHHVPMFVMGEIDPDVSMPQLASDLEELLPQALLRGVDVFYIGDFKELKGRNAAYADGAVYISNREPTNEDIVENVVHEVAHSLAENFSNHVYDASLVSEFKAKRETLKNVLASHGYRLPDPYFDNIEYNKRFDQFLADDVGYPTLLNLTMGLFASPYGATSIAEYFANGFEKYFLDSPYRVQKISPVLYQKIEEIVDA